MKYYNMFDLRIQDLYVFVCTAEFQNITKAAAFLYLTPSQVSKIIRKLEDQWGIQLFIRDKNLIHLTPAGRHVYQGLHNITGNIENVIETAISIQEVRPLIRIACPTLSRPNELFAPVIKEYEKTHPNTAVTIECQDTLYMLKKMLIGKDVDIIFTADAELTNQKEIIDWISIEKLPLYIIMDREHPLAGRSSLTVEDLRHQKFVLTRPVSGEYTDYAVKICAQHGFSPIIARYVPNIYSQFMEVSINPDVVCIQTIKGLDADDSLYYFKLPDLFWEMGFAWRKDSSALISDFVNCAAKHLKKQLT